MSMVLVSTDKGDIKIDLKSSYMSIYRLLRWHFNHVQAMQYVDQVATLFCLVNVYIWIKVSSRCNNMSSQIYLKRP